VIKGKDWANGRQQLTFPDYEINTAKKQGKEEKFFSEKEVVVPWNPFAGINLISERIPDETTILILFRRHLEKRELGKQFYCFSSRRLRLRRTIRL
jgi:hypothetical protein